MTREIKFRAWDKLNEKMGDVLQYLPYAGTYGAIKISQGNTGYMSYDFELMQYIGMQDIEGNDLYEGDLVKSYAGDTYEIKANGPAFFFTDIKDEHKQEYLFDSNNMQNLLLIGNIYSNPDLIPN